MRLVGRARGNAGDDCASPALAEWSGVARTRSGRTREAGEPGMAEASDSPSACRMQQPP